MSKQQEIREQVTARIVAALEKDNLPWRRPWVTRGPGRHTNVVSKRPYSGVNPLLLEIHAAAHGFRSHWWGTFNQWHSLGCTVQRRPDGVEPGQWGCGIVVYIPVTKKDENPDTGEEEEETYWLLRKFTLFNANQVSGLRADLYRLGELPPKPTEAQPDYQPAEELIAKSGADIRYGGDRAYYRLPSPEGSWPNHTAGDYIEVPPKASFIGGAFYPTILHELAHWSEIRVGWDREKGGYAAGELVAEIASCFLATELGVPNGEPLENYAAYLKSWLEAMKSDANYIFKASRQASKVCDFLLSFVRQDATEPTPELVEAA
jgi:antirestriction protein ArdC